MGGGNDGRWEVKPAFFPVYCEEIVFYEENEKNYTTVTPVIFHFFMFPQIFFTIGPIQKRMGAWTQR